MKQKSLVALYVNYSLYNFSLALVGIFIPIYFLKLGFGLAAVFSYLAIYSVSTFLFTVVAGLMSNRIGMKRTMLLYFPLIFTFFAMILSLKYFDIPLWIIGIFNGGQMAFYWYPLNVFFVSCSSDDKMGEGYAKLNAYPKAIGWIAPLLGGFIAAAFSQGFAALFILAALISLVSLAPILYMEDIFPNVRFQTKPFFGFFWRYPKYIFIETIHYFQVFSEYTIWPIFVFVTFDSIFSIGVVGTMLAIGSYFMMMFAGFRSDTGKRKNLLLVGAGIMAIIWALRAVTHGQVIFYALTAAAGFFEALILIPFNSFSFGLAKKGARDEFIIFREFPVMAGRLLAIAAAFIFMQNLQSAFIPLAISQLVFLLF